MVAREGQWQSHAHGGYRPVAVDGTGFWRPRLAVPRAFVRVDPADPTPGASERRLASEAARRYAADEVLVPDAGFGLARRREGGTPRDVVRLAKNAAFRRAVPPPYISPRDSGGSGVPRPRPLHPRPLPKQSELALAGDLTDSTTVL